VPVDLMDRLSGSIKISAALLESAKAQ